MMNNTFYNEILTDHNLHPVHKKKLEDANLVLEGVNPSCGDDIILELKEENGVITDGAFVGTSFKKDGVFWNQIDKDRVKAFMDKVNTFR